MCACNLGCHASCTCSCHERRWRVVDVQPACESCGGPIREGEPAYKALHGKGLAHFRCPGTGLPPKRDTALDRALAAPDLSAFKVGQRVYVNDFQRDHVFTGTILDIQPDRAAGQIFVEGEVDGGSMLDYYLPQAVRPVPTTVEEIDAFLAS